MNCQPGDLAIIVTCPGFPENVGGWVRVLCASALPGHDWRVVALQPLHGMNVWSGVPITVRPGQHVEAHDAWLRPIRGQEDECEQEKREQEKQA